MPRRIRLSHGVDHPAAERSAMGGPRSAHRGGLDPLALQLGHELHQRSRRTRLRHPVPGARPLLPAACADEHLVHARGDPVRDRRGTAGLPGRGPRPSGDHQPRDPARRGHGAGRLVPRLCGRRGPQSGPARGGAAVGIVCANTIAIIAGSLRGLRLPLAYRVFSIAVGALGLLSELLVGMSASTAGIFERGGVYSWLLWSVATGALLLVWQVGRPTTVENV